MRGTAFDKAKQQGAAAPVEDAPAAEAFGKVSFVSEEISKSDRCVSKHEHEH